MLRVETTIGTENHIPFSTAWADTGQAIPEATTRQAGSTRGGAARGLNLSGYQLLFGCAFLMGLAGVALWALELWLFEL
jgi:hypothetical protein